MILFDILGNKLFRAINYPQRTPLSLSLSVTGKCNSRCRTCNIWEKKDVGQELTIDEYGKIFSSFRKPPLELIFTGGEPFIRQDLAQICQMGIERLRPKAVIIPSNGILTEKIVTDVKMILENSARTNIIINISLDGIKNDNDEIRGVEGSFDRAMDTYRALSELKNDLLNLKIHTVVSSYNADKIPRIYEYVRKVLKTNLYIIEIAQERSELYNLGRGKEIMPSRQKYSEITSFLSKHLAKEEFSGLSKVIQASRLEYYRLSEKTLERERRMIPCYAGFAAGQITCEGDVCFCATRANSIGNLRSNNYDFQRIWFSREAKEEREKSKRSNCYCLLANVAYINMLHDFNSLLKISVRLSRNIF